MRISSKKFEKKSKRRNKYKAVQVSCGGYLFGSRFEHAVYEHLKAQEAEGILTVLATQYEVRLTDAQIIYKADFFVEYKNPPQMALVEAKGFPTDTWRLKLKLYEHYGPFPLYLYEGRYDRFKLTNVIIPNRLKKVSGKL